MSTEALPLVIFIDNASLLSQLSIVAEGMRIRISLAPSISAVHIEDLFAGLFCIARNNFPISVEGMTERLFGPGD